MTAIAPDQACERLKRRVALSVAFEEALTDVLAAGAADFRREGFTEVALEIEVFIRRHRVGLIKNRAIMGAHGIEI